MAALVVVTLSHCSWQEARELVQWTHTVSLHRAGLPTPMQMPVHDCDHEYSCMCRGATVVQSVDVTLFQAQMADLLSVHLNYRPLAYLLDNGFERVLNEHHHSPPPLSGRQLRALYATLVI